jgi:hypothetical protein
MGSEKLKVIRFGIPGLDQLLGCPGQGDHWRAIPPLSASSVRMVPASRFLLSTWFPDTSRTLARPTEVSQRGPSTSRPMRDTTKPVPSGMVFAWTHPTRGGILSTTTAKHATRPSK